MNHSKSGPFQNRTKIDHFKSRHVQISDPHFIGIPTVFHFRTKQNPKAELSVHKVWKTKIGLSLLQLRKLKKVEPKNKNCGFSQE